MNASARPTSAMLTLPAGARMPESCHSPARITTDSVTPLAAAPFHGTPPHTLPDIRTAHRRGDSLACARMAP